MAASAWDLALRAAHEAGVAIRPLTSLHDADRIVDVMVATWGPYQLLPREMIRALQGSGNVPLGAFVEDALVGYVLGFLGPRSEGIHVHSHMLAVVPRLRHGGVGYALKLAQRAAALDAGIRVARWTFDPLVARNAYFNLSKLGAVADGFHRHFYGEMTDELNRGDRTDRLEARWDLDREPGPHGVDASDASVVLSPESDEEDAKPGPVRPPGERTAVIHVPQDYPGLRERDRALAAAWRDATAEAFEACFEAGMVATGFIRPGAYVFTAGPV